MERQKSLEDLRKELSEKEAELEKAKVRAGGTQNEPLAK